MKNRIPWCALLLSLAAVPALAQDAQPAACQALTSLPATISAPGNYCLTGNHTTAITSGNLITIAANDVTLDCQDHTLRSTATNNNASSSAVYALDRNNLMIKNCRIIGGFTNGINVRQNLTVPNKSYYTVIMRNFVAGPFWQGIVAYGSGIEVRENRVYDIGGQLNNYAIGIRVGGSSASAYRFQMVEGNLVAGTNSPNKLAYGIFSDRSIGAIFHDNVITGTTASSATQFSYGIRIADGAGNTITENYVHDAGPAYSNAYGIHGPEGMGVCYDNQIWSSLATTTGCDASMGNF